MLKNFVNTVKSDAHTERTQMVPRKLIWDTNSGTFPSKTVRL